MTEIDRNGPKIWTNEHQSRTNFMRRSAQLKGPHSADLVTAMQERRRVLGDFIAEEVEHEREICVTGSSWSQSDLFRGLSTLLETDDDHGVWAIPDDAFADGVTGRHRYVMVAGGTKVFQLMEWLEADGRELSLATAGSHKGQSVAGITATGSHGSTLECTGCEQHVRGMLLSTGKDRAVWLGDPRKPLLKDSFVQQFAEIGDPAHFPAALVHMGGMGVVSALLIEAVDAFHLGLVKRMRVLPDDWATLVSQARFDAAVGQLAHGRKTHYYEITLDPFRGMGHEALETIWLRLDGDGNGAVPAAAAPAPARTGLEHISTGAARRLGQMSATPPDATLSERAIRDLLDLPEMVWDGFRKDDAIDARDTPHRLSQLCAEWKPHRLLGIIRVDVYNAAFAVPLDRVADALSIGMTMAQGAEFSRDFVFTVRFACKSPAAMGFLRFDRNAIINIDGLSKNFILGSDAHVAAKRLQYLFDKAGLPYSMHWGKDAQCGAAKIAADYGAGVIAYRAARYALLGDAAPRFTSPALEEWGLA